jgi:hypothetical protein
MALKAELAQQKQNTHQLVERTIALIGKVVERNKRNPGNQSPFQYPQWINTPPHSMTEVIKVMNGKEYVWCTKCRCNEGLWVCTHTSKTHQDGYKCNKTNRQNTPENKQHPYPHLLQNINQNVQH